MMDTATFTYAIGAYGFLIERNTTVTCKQWAELIRRYSGHYRSQHIADLLSNLDKQVHKDYTGSIEVQS